MYLECRSCNLCGPEDGRLSRTEISTMSFCIGFSSTWAVDNIHFPGTPTLFHKKEQSAYVHPSEYGRRDSRKRIGVLVTRSEMWAVWFRTLKYICSISAYFRQFSRLQPTISAASQFQCEILYLFCRDSLSDSWSTFSFARLFIRVDTCPKYSNYRGWTPAETTSARFATGDSYLTRYRFSPGRSPCHAHRCGNEDTAKGTNEWVPMGWR